MPVRLTKRDRLAANRQVRPEGRPIADIAGAVEQLVDQGGPFGRIFVPVKAIDFVPGGNMSHEVEMDAAEPLFVVGSGRRADVVIGPALADLLIDEGDDRIVGTGPGGSLILGSLVLDSFSWLRPGIVGRRGKS